jgi:hypothetical protein
MQGRQGEPSSSNRSPQGPRYRSPMWSPRRDGTTTSRAASPSWWARACCSRYRARARSGRLRPTRRRSHVLPIVLLARRLRIVHPAVHGIFGVRHAPAWRSHRARPVAVDLADLQRHRVQHDAAGRRGRRQFLRPAAVGLALCGSRNAPVRFAGWCCGWDSSASSSSPIRARIRSRSVHCSRSAKP